MKRRKISIVMAGLLVGLLGTSMEALAAGPEPVVSNLCIVDTGSGISARCDYDDYAAGSDYDIQLYLDQWNGDTRNTVQLTIVAKNGAGTGQTDAVMADSGVYSVTAVVRDNVTPGATARYYETGKYRVVKTDSGYEITKWKADSPAGSKNTSDSKSPKGRDSEDTEPQIPICEHIFEEVQMSEADPDHDAVMAMQCKFCGETKDYFEVPNSAYACFQKESAQKILDAATGGEAVITTARWFSFHHMVTDAMAERPDVKITVVYRYKGLDDTVIIPAAADRTALANEDGYCGFLYLRHIFG